MKKTIFVVSYSSYYDEIYNEVQVCATKDDAQKAFDKYVDDIAESYDDTDRQEEIKELYKGKDYLSETMYGGREFLVQISENTLDF